LSARSRGQRFGLGSTAAMSIEIFKRLHETNMIRNRTQEISSALLRFT
jgi:hypothetical protein